MHGHGCIFSGKPQCQNSNKKRTKQTKIRKKKRKRTKTFRTTTEPEPMKGGNPKRTGHAIACPALFEAC